MKENLYIFLSFGAGALQFDNSTVLPLRYTKNNLTVEGVNNMPLYLLNTILYNDIIW